MHTLHKLSLLPLLLASNGLIASPALAASHQLKHPQPVAQAFDDIRLLLPSITVIDGSRLQLSGSHETIFADGSEFDLDLSGQDGRDARHPDVSGQAGEPGGDGGTLTVYYTDLAHLQNIYVDASGGKGGAGLPSRTTYHCPPPPMELPMPELDMEPIPLPELPQPEDQIKQSSTSFPNDFDFNVLPHPQTPRSSCTPITSAPGPTGEDGRPGQLRIINREELLPPETPQVSATVAELIEQPVDLSKHLWRERQGAADLLAPGSIVADEYQEYVEQLEVTAQLQWEASLEASQATLYLQEDGQVLIDLGEEMWSLSENRQRDDLTEVAITTLVPEAEVLDLVEGGFQLSGDILNLVVIDLAGHSKALDTTFHIHYRSTDRHQLDTPRKNWQARYQGEVLAAAVTQDYNRFSLDLSQLPIEPQYLRPGVPVQIELVVTRSLGQRSATTILNWQETIR